MRKAAKKIGRPTKAANPGTRVSLGLKVTADLKAKLEAAAAASGRTQSQEAELRLENSFRDEAAFQDLFQSVLDLAFGPELGRLMRLVGNTMQAEGSRAAFEHCLSVSVGTTNTLAASDWQQNGNETRSANVDAAVTAGEQWFSDGIGYARAVGAALAVLLAARPADEIDSDQYGARDELRERLAVASNPDAINSASKPEIRSGALRIRDHAGPLADRLRPVPAVSLKVQEESK